MCMFCKINLHDETNVRRLMMRTCHYHVLLCFVHHSLAHPFESLAEIAHPLESTGNPLPSFRILNAFSDEHIASILDDSSVAISAPNGDIISLVCAREEAQAALAAAAARCADRNALAIIPVEAGGEAVPILCHATNHPHAPWPTMHAVPCR